VVTGRYLPMGSMAAGSWCDRCGEAIGSGDHAGCLAARALEPPRYCAFCRRRLKVQVLPAGWRSVCVEHGETSTG
jgi:hypothetical protein